jgi:hypothetical protein
MLLKGALHVHTTCSDGVLTIPEVASVYGELGFGFVAITDHDHLVRDGCLDSLADLQATCEPLLFRGVELTVFEKGYLHVCRIEGDAEVLHVFAHPAQLDLPLDKVIERIAAVARSLPIDVVEVTSQGFYTPEFDVPRIPYPKVATDDAHDRKACGRAWIELDAARDKDAIIRAIKRGEFRNCYSNQDHQASVGVNAL